MKIKAATYNTQHCNYYPEGRIDFDKMADAIRSFDADIVGLNEIRGEGPDEFYTDQLGALLERLPGYDGRFIPAISLPEGLYGNAIISRRPILSCEKIKIPDPEKRPGVWYETRCIIRAVIDVGQPLTVLVSHFGLNPEERVSAVRTVSGLIDGEKCILMGDFNCEPDDPVLLPIREIMNDTAVRFDCPKLSFTSDKPTCKIDYIFTSKDIETVSADIPALIVSDHRPHLAELNI